MIFDSLDRESKRTPPFVSFMSSFFLSFFFLKFFFFFWVKPQLDSEFSDLDYNIGPSKRIMGFKQLALAKPRVLALDFGTELDNLWPHGPFNTDPILNESPNRWVIQLYTPPIPIIVV